MTGFLTDQQRVDVRRFCGYPAYAYFGWVFEEDYATLELRMDNMSANETAVITSTYLPTLYTLEAAIPTASDNLDTDQAAVWKHNANEISDRRRIYNDARLDLCGFIGIKPGRGMSMSCSVVRT